MDEPAVKVRSDEEAPAPKLGEPSSVPFPLGRALPSSPRSLSLLVRSALLVSGALPWIVPYARAHLPLGEAGVMLDRVFLPMCHRIPARTMVLSGVLMPLCSRCAGIFAGVAIGALAGWPRVSMKVWRPVLAVSAALMLIEIATQDLGLHPVFHPTRVATGILLGYAMAAALVTSLPRLRA